MAALNRRKGPNVSQYLAGLNTINNAPSDDSLAQDDLSLFANTEWFDFDMGDNAGGVSAPAVFDANHTERKQNLQDPSTNFDFLSGMPLFRRLLLLPFFISSVSISLRLYGCSNSRSSASLSPAELLTTCV